MNPDFPSCTITWITILLVLVSVSNSQDDQELWLSFELEHELSGKLKLACEQELRLDEDYSNFKSTLTNATLYYTINRGFKILGAVRHQIYTKRTRQRLSLGGMYAIAKGNYKLNYRLKLQETVERNESPEFTFRNKLALETELSKRFTPGIAVESFHTQDQSWQFTEYRLNLELKYRIAKKRTAELFYIYKKEDINKSNPDLIGVTGLKYEIEF